MQRSPIMAVILAGGAMLAGGAGLPDAPKAAPDTARGKQLYTYWCATCHAHGPGNPGTQSLEVKYKGAMPAALEDRTNLPPQVTTYFVRNGVALMPPFRKTEVSDADLRDIAAYLDRKR
jgi:mono/diheme cytochrome c family protein